MAECEFILNSCDLCVSSVDQEQLDKEINDLRKGLKAKVNRLNEMQGMRSILTAVEFSWSRCPVSITIMYLGNLETL